MKRILTAIFVLTCFPVCLPAVDTLSLIFPDKDEVIRILKSAGREEGLLVGEEIPSESELTRKILAELDLPFHRSILKLSQCSRNFSGDTEGPNVLLLSQQEGGFPRHGLALRCGGDRRDRYPDLNYVDLVLDENRVDRGDLDIYSHELGHVMMMNIMPDFPRGKSRKQHVSMGITDYMTAFFEGWGIHFQRLAYEKVARYRQADLAGYDYSRSTSRLWHSAMDKELRLDAVLKNDYIHRRLLPAVDTSGMGPEELILLEHASPIFDRTRLKNAQQMLSCEGVIATLFYRINTNKKFQSNFVDRNFYNRFLISPMPDDINPQDIFTPFENVFLKSFLIWDRISKKLNPDSEVFLEFIQEWMKSFPGEAEEILRLFLLTTAGRTVGDEMAGLYERMSYSGMVGNIQEYRRLFQEYIDVFRSLLKGISSGKILLNANLGPQLWVENRAVLVRTALWSPFPKRPLYINLNTASLYELSSFPGVGLEKARMIIERRDERAFFRTVGEAGFK